MGFPGSFTASLKTYRYILEDYCESLVKSGFKDIVLITSHGGNTNVMKAITPYIARKFFNRIKIHFIDSLSLGHEEKISYLEQLGISRFRDGVHAGFSETPMMLAVAPELVKMELAESGFVDESFYDPKNISRSQIVTFILGTDYFSKNGILGDPLGAEKEKGERFLEIIVESLVKTMSDILA